MKMTARLLTATVLATCFANLSPAFAADFVVGPQTGTNSGNTRGYYFTATSAFTIDSLFIPTDASTGNQWAEVVRLNSIPAAYPTTTNNFTNLGYFANQDGASSIATSIAVSIGDIIGILGSRSTSTISSYATGPYTSTINSLPVTLQRLGFQDSLVNGAAHDLFVEPTSTNYSRINFSYSAAGAVPEPASWAMMILGMGAVGFAMRRRVRASEVKFSTKIKRIAEGATA